MQHSKLKKELKEEIFELLRISLFEVLRMQGENVILYKQLRISMKKTSSGNVYKIQDTNEETYNEINNLYLLDLIRKEILDGIKPKEAKTPVNGSRAMEKSRLQGSS